jgi:iron(III) transport system permease protein
VSTAAADRAVLSGQGRRAPVGLVAVAALTVVPLVFPFGFLLWQSLAGGWQTVLPPGRLAELAVNTLVLTGIVVVGAVLIGSATAWLTTRTDLPGARVWSTAVALPLVIPSYVLALVLLTGTGRQGILSEVAVAMGGSSLPIPRGLFGAVLALVVSTFPYVHLSLVPALRTVDPALDEIARALGAGRLKRMRTVLLAHVGPALRSSALLVGLYTLADFGAVSLLGYDTFTRAIFLQYAGRIDRRPATLLAAALVLMALAVIGLERFTRPPRRERRGRVVRPPRQHQLSSRQRFGAVTFLTLLVTASVGVPVAVLGAWWVRGTVSGRETVAVWSEMGRSISVSIGAALVVAAIAIPIAVLIIRYRSRFGVILEATAWTVSALPHLTVGLALLLVGVTFLLPLYQTLSLLLVAYVTMFLPQALGPTEAALREVSPNLEEVSRSLGHSPLETFRRITMPLIGKGVLIGAGLVFLTTMKELPATLLLRPTEFETLAVRIWSTTSEGFYTRAAFASLVLIMISALPMHFLVSRDLRNA